MGREVTMSVRRRTVVRELVVYWENVFADSTE